MAPVNKRRRSILKMSGSSAGAGGDLDFDVSNAENININASIVGPRKRVSFGRKRIKEISPIRKSSPVNRSHNSSVRVGNSTVLGSRDMDMDLSTIEPSQHYNDNAASSAHRNHSVRVGNSTVIGARDMDLSTIEPYQHYNAAPSDHRNRSVRVGNSTVMGSRDMDMDLSTIEPSQHYNDNAASSAHRNHSVRVGNSTVIGARDMDLTKEISPIRKSSTVNRSHNSSLRVGNSTVMGSRDMDMDLSTIEPSQHYNDNAAPSAHRNRSVRVGNSTVMGSRDMDMDLSTIEPSQHYNDNAAPSAHRNHSVRVGNSTVIGARDMDLTRTQDPFKHYAAAAPPSFSYGLSVPAPITVMNRKTLCNPFQKRKAKIAGMFYSVKTPKRAAFRCRENCEDDLPADPDTGCIVNPTPCASAWASKTLPKELEQANSPGPVKPTTPSWVSATFSKQQEEADSPAKPSTPAWASTTFSKQQEQADSPANPSTPAWASTTFSKEQEEADSPAKPSTPAWASTTYSREQEQADSPNPSKEATPAAPAWAPTTPFSEEQRECEVQSSTPAAPTPDWGSATFLMEKFDSPANPNVPAEPSWASTTFSKDELLEDQEQPRLCDESTADNEAASEFHMHFYQTMQSPDSTNCCQAVADMQLPINQSVIMGETEVSITPEPPSSCEESLEESNMESEADSTLKDRPQQPSYSHSHHRVSVHNFRFQPAAVQRLPVNQSVVVPEKKRLNDLHLSSELFEYVIGGWKKMDFDARFQKRQTFYQELAKMNEAAYQKFQTTYGDCFTIYYFKEVDNYRKEFRELGHCNPLILHL